MARHPGSTSPRPLPLVLAVRLVLLAGCCYCGCYGCRSCLRRLLEGSVCLGVFQHASCPLCFSVVGSSVSAPKRDKIWRAKLIDLHSFIEDAGRLPKRDVPTTRERKLANWIHDQRAAFVKGKLSSDRRADLQQGHPLLSQRVEQWRTGYRPRKQPQLFLRWGQRLGRVLKFIRMTGRLPSVRADDTNESSGAHWFKRQKCRLFSGIMSSEERTALRQSHPLVAQRLEKWIEEGYLSKT